MIGNRITGAISELLNFGSSSSITPTLDVNIEEILAIRDGANDLIDAYEGVDDVVKQTAKSLNENVTAQQLSNAAMAQSTASTQMNTTATTANTVAQKAWNVAKSAGNVLLSAGVAIIGTMIATQLLSWLNDVIHAEERLAEAANDAVTNMKDLNSTFEEHKKYVDKNIESYEELSKGVDELSNKNVSLSTDEYEKYLEINEQLVEMFPSLKTGIDDNGNSILNLGKNGRSAAEDLNELLEAERKLNDYKISKDAETIYADFQNQYDDYQKLREESDDTVSHLEDNLQKIENLQGKINISDLIISGTSDNQADIEMYNAISEAYQRFNTEDMNKYRVTHENLPNKDIFKPINDGKLFISIDMRKANFSSLYHYDNNMFSGAKTWEEFISKFTNNKHIINSKYIRQVILGNCNPKRHITYERYLMDMVLTYLVEAYVPMNRIIFFSNDEIVIDISDINESGQKLLFFQIEIGMNDMAIPLKMELFILHKIDNIDGYYKEIFKKNGEKDIEFKCLDNYMLPFVARSFLGEEITDSDKIFYHEGLLAQFIEIPKIKL